VLLPHQQDQAAQELPQPQWLLLPSQEHPWVGGVLAL
jgi:hypothetical protein